MGTQDRSRGSLLCAQPASLSLSTPSAHLQTRTHTEAEEKSGRQLPPPQPATVHQQNETFYKEINLHAN